MSVARKGCVFRYVLTPNCTKHSVDCSFFFGYIVEVD